jgi:hypothetical protein
MKCQEVNKLLVAYLDNEVTPSERTLMRAHLAGCESCQEELAMLSSLQSRVSQFLQIRAAQVAPSPQAWGRLQARRAAEARPSPSQLAWSQRLVPGADRINRIFQGGVRMKKEFVLATIATVVIALSAVAFVPSVQAEFNRMITIGFHLSSTQGVEMTVNGPVAFVPLYPTYLPAALKSGVSTTGGTQATNGGLASFEQTYRNDTQFVAISQTKASGDRSLPGGQSMSIKSQPAVLVAGLKGTFVDGSSIPEGAKVEACDTPPQPIAYTDGKRLTWYVGDVRVEILSNLSLQEMAKIAESLVPAKTGGLPAHLTENGGSDHNIGDKTQHGNTRSTSADHSTDCHP